MPRFGRLNRSEIEAQHLAVMPWAGRWVNVHKAGVVGRNYVVVAVRKLPDPVMGCNHVRQIERDGEWNAAFVLLIVMQSV
jgi:hypothetical protein